MNLPNASGFDLFDRFREHPGCLTTPVIVVTSSNGERDRERARGMGAARYFRKPSDLDEFLKLGAVVNEVARRDSQE